MAWITDSLRSAIASINPFRQQYQGQTALSGVFSSQLAIAAYLSSGMLRKVIAIPASDRVREWRDWQADKDSIAAIEAEEKRLGLVAKVKYAEVLRGIGGGALILVTPGDSHADPLNPDTVKAGDLVAINVVNRWELVGKDWDKNLASPTFGQPAMWEINGGGRDRQPIHPSRVVCFRGEPLPSNIGVSDEDAFWGDSRLLRVLAEVNKADNASLWFSELVKKAKLLRFGIPNLADMAAAPGGREKLAARIATIAEGESVLNATVYEAGDGKGAGSANPGEVITDYQINWTGIPAMMDAFDQRVAAVADIPFTRLMGRSPAGMNSTGAYDDQNWSKAVAAGQQLETRPCLEAFDAVLLRSAGADPTKVTWRWAPLWLPTEKEESETFKAFMDALEKVQNSGAIPDKAFAEAFQNWMEEREYMPGLSAALAKVPESERFGLSPDDDGSDPSALQAHPEGMAGKTQRAVQQEALNGAQITSLIGLIQSVEAGQVDKETASEIIRVAFPTLAAQQVQALLENAGDDPDGYLQRLSLAKRGAGVSIADPSVSPQHQREGGDPASADDPASVEVAGRRRATDDAKPIPLYVQRKLLNADELIRWAKGQGFPTTLEASDMHVTVLYSRNPVDPIKMGSTWSDNETGELMIKPGGPRAVEKLGESAVVLLFSSDDLAWRHRAMIEAGASHDYDEYQPHVTITYDGGEIDLDAVKPFTGALRFGPELFEPLDLDWKEKVTEQ